METRVEISPPVRSLQDIVNIAKIKGKRQLGVKYVNVKPGLYFDGNVYIVKVECEDSPFRE